MLTRTVSVPELGLIAGTRMALGAGIGLLLADHVKPEQRRAVGWTLLAVGLLTTVPLAADVLFRHQGSKNGNQDEHASEHPGEMVPAHDTF
jgi:uncharacterized membrane protein YfcA